MPIIVKGSPAWDALLDEIKGEIVKLGPQPTPEKLSNALAPLIRTGDVLTVETAIRIAAHNETRALNCPDALPKPAKPAPASEPHNQSSGAVEARRGAPLRPT